MHRQLLQVRAALLQHWLLTEQGVPCQLLSPQPCQIQDLHASAAASLLLFPLVMPPGGSALIGVAPKGMPRPPPCALACNPGCVPTIQACAAPTSPLQV